MVAIDGRTALTLYANEDGPDHCGDGTGELTPVQYSEADVSSAARDGLTYVFESYYPTQCHDVFPTEAQVAREMKKLRALYPHALVGFGEVGLPHPVDAHNLVTAERVMSWAYGLDPTVCGYVGGYFWWYAREDAFLGKTPLRSALGAAFDAERVALGGPATTGAPVMPSGLVSERSLQAILRPHRDVAPALAHERLPLPSLPSAPRASSRRCGP